MRAATVEDVAQEFMRILAEGWSPDPEEFLHRVPEDLRADCRARLEELLGEAASAGRVELAAEPEPVEEEYADDVIVFELDSDGPIQTVKVPSVGARRREPEPEEMVEEQAAELVEPTAAIAAEAALEPELLEEEPETDDMPEAGVVEEPVVPAVPEPKPQGLVKLSREEAKAMFAAMERARQHAG